MNPKAVECWNKALEEFHKAEVHIQSKKDSNVIIELLKSSIGNGISSIIFMGDGEKDLAIGDIVDYGEEIKGKSIPEVLRITRKCLCRLRDSSPPEYHLPKP